MWDLPAQLVFYFPRYVLLVLAPALVRITIERALGVRHEEFSLPPPRALAYETAFRSLVLTSLYYPFFEEVVFRGAPLYLFGFWGLVIGSIVWVVVHPSWQLQYLSEYPTWKKVAFTLTTSFYYACNALFYGSMWLEGAGVAAIIYHSAHNTWLTVAEWLKEAEIPSLGRPWGRREPAFVREREGEALGAPLALRFVHRKEPGEAAPGAGMFVRRKAKNMGGGQ